MKRYFVFILVLVIASFLAFIGCEKKQDALPPSSPTVAPAPVPPPAPAPAMPTPAKPAKK